MSNPVPEIILTPKLSDADAKFVESLGVLFYSTYRVTEKTGVLFTTPSIVSDKCLANVMKALESGALLIVVEEDITKWRLSIYENLAMQYNAKITQL